MKPSYAKWKARLAGEKVPTHPEPDENDCGFYRFPVKEKQPNGRWKVIDYKPVAIFVAGEQLFCTIGSEGPVGEDRRNDAWTWVVQNPITEEVWRAVAEEGKPWPDFQPTTTEPAPAEETPAQKIAREIAEAKKDLPKFAKIESDEQSSKARSLQQRFLDARGTAAKAYEAANRPLLDAQKKLREEWFPLRDEADAANETLRKAMGAWEDQKREAARKAAAEAERKAREHAEAVRKAEEANQPPPPPPMESKPNTPPPSDQIKAPGARAASVRVRKVVTEIDIDKAFAQFKNAAEVREVLMKLAQRAVDAGLPVDGATIEERSEVR